MKSRSILFLTSALLGLSVVGCSKSEPAPEPVQEAAKPAEPVQEAAPSPVAAPEAAPAPAAGANPVTENPDGTVTVAIESVGETMAYNVTDITVSAGKKITVNLKNNATTPVMKHNFVLIQKGKEDEVGMAALQAGEAKDYIPENPAILAHTKLSGPGETVSVTFDAPAAGEYAFICTFPGHYAIMRGKLTVK